MAKQGLLQGEDGFYVGRVLKNGELSKDAYKLSKEDIVFMYSELVQDYCLRTGQPMDIMRNDKPFIRSVLVVR